MTEKCGGLHCPGCGHGGGFPGGAVALLIVVVVAAGTAAARAVWHGILTGLEIAGYTLASLAGLAVVGALSYGGYRAYRWHAGRRAAAPVRVIAVRLEPSQPAGASAPASRPALEAPRMRPASWPLPGQWDQVRPAGGDRDAN